MATVRALKPGAAQSQVVAEGVSKREALRTIQRLEGDRLKVKRITRLQDGGRTYAVELVTKTGGK